MIRPLVRTMGFAVGTTITLFTILALGLLLATLAAPKDVEPVYVVLAILLFILGMVNWAMLGILLVALHRHPDHEALQQRAQEALLSALGGTCIALVGLHLVAPVAVGPPLSTFLLVIGVFLLSAPAILFLVRYWRRP